MATPHDPKSVAGKSLPVQESCQLLVIGAGPAGLAAAAHAAQLGLKVVLVDENPVPATVMSDDIPLHFGQRFSAAARNRTAMTGINQRARAGDRRAVRRGRGRATGHLGLGPLCQRS